MKLFRVLTAVVFFALSGCATLMTEDNIKLLCQEFVPCAGCVDPPVIPPPTPEDPDPGISFVVAPGVNHERTVKVPGSVSFTIVPGPTDQFADALKNNFMWVRGVGGEWTGGRDAKPFEVGARSYKVKAMWKEGRKTKWAEPRYGSNWQTGVPVNVQAAWTRTSFTITIGAAAVPPIPIKLPEEIVVGLGWPPSGRNGMAGSSINNVTWR